jgi:inorganic triphosphatase YgiF
VRKLGKSVKPDSPAEQYHELRIRAKKLRYALEFFAQIYGKPAQALIKRLVRLQDNLGKHQDAMVGVQHLREWSQARRLLPLTVFVIGRTAERYAQQAAQLRAEFSEAFKAIQGKPWKDLRRQMRHLRPATAAAKRPRRVSSHQAAPASAANGSQPDPLATDP